MDSQESKLLVIAFATILAYAVLVFEKFFRENLRRKP